MLRILHLEDSNEDAYLVRRMLSAEGVGCAVETVENRSDYEAALESKSFDMIFADYTLPSFNGLHALEMAQQKSPDTPFIFVTGTMGEEIAIDSLKKGATDYVLKSRLARLVPAMRRALKEREDRDERRRAEEAKRSIEERYRNLVEAMSEGLGVQDSNGLLTFMNRRACEMLGYELSELLNKPTASLFDEENREILRRQMELRRKGVCSRYEIVWTRKDGEKIHTIMSPTLIRDEKGDYSGSIAVFTDITERKRTEEELRQRIDELERFRSATIKREFRIKELKDRVKKLEEEARNLKAAPGTADSP